MCTRACPAACTCVSRAVGRLRQPLHNCAAVSRSHGLRMCEIHCTIVILPADMRVSQESDWNTAESAHFQQCYVSSPSVRTHVSSTPDGVEDGRPLS